MPALQGCDSRVIFCTARSCTELHGPTRCTELHGSASHRGCTALHGPPSNGSCMALHGRAAARALRSIIQPTAPPSHRDIYLTATVTTALKCTARPAPAWYCTNWRTNCAARSCTDPPVKPFCTELHGPAEIRRCTELPGFHAAVLSSSRGCNALHGNFLVYIYISICICICPPQHLT